MPIKWSEMTPEQIAEYKRKTAERIAAKKKARASRWMDVGMNPAGTAMRLSFSDGWKDSEIEAAQGKVIAAQAEALVKARSGK